MVLFIDAHDMEPQLGTVATVTEKKKASAAQEAVRPPLLPSERNNAAAAAATAALRRKPQAREVASRYKFGAANPTNATAVAVSSRRANAASRLPSPSPAVSGRVGPTAPGQMQQKRSQSAERRSASAKVAPAPAPPRRPAAPSSPSSSRTSASSSPSSSRSSTPVRDSWLDVHASSKRVGAAAPRRSVDGLWPSMRSLSSSLNSEPASPPAANKDKASPAATKTTAAVAAPDTKSKPSTDLTPKDSRKRTPLRGRNNVSDQSENSNPVDVPRPRATAVPAKAVDQPRWPGSGAVRFSAKAMTKSVDLTPSFPVTSQRGLSPRRSAPSSDDASVKTLFPKSTNDRSRRMSLDGTRRADTQIGSIFPASSKPPPLERSSSTTRPSTTLSLPRPPSPIKHPFPGASSVRGMPSPSRTRPSTPVSSAPSATGRSIISSSVLSYIADAKKVKKNANQLEDVHQLRLLHNRCLQWRFANAMADVAHSNQKTMAESVLHSVLIGILELQKSILLKKISIQKQRQGLKLNMVLRGQMAYLEDWALLEREHSSSLSGAIEALTAGTIRLPVTGGATASLHDVRNALCSALDVMQAVGFSMCHLLPRVEDTVSVVSELAGVAANERAMIDDCSALLALTTATQVQESSLQTHLLQLIDNKMQLS